MAPSSTRMQTISNLMRLFLILAFILACGGPKVTPTITPKPPTETPEPPNAVPIASNSDLYVQQGTSGSLDLKSLASDPDTKDQLIFSIESVPQHGKATISGSDLAFTPDADYLGTDQLTYQVNDGRGGIAKALITITISIAPSLTTNEITSFSDATDFLYTGDNPIQTGVAPGTIEEKRVAVLRGLVTDRDNKPLVGVKITVLNHPEYGETLTRDGGIFDIAVNGGGLLVLDYEKTGYLSAQRQIDVPWQDYVQLPDVVLINDDSPSSFIDLTQNTMQVARGRLETDSDGARRQILFFPPGTKAEMVFSDGTAQEITSMHVRSTEFTVGDNGLEAMPAELPANSSYTYAVSFQAEEAETAGAETVRFTPPIISYVENFLNFDTGEAMPMGFYDDQKGVWVPFESGKIIRIISISNGKANLDIDGSGIAATQSALVELGITDAESEELAKLYPEGQSLWRISVPHFSKYDANMGVKCQDPCPSPDAPKPALKDTEKPNCESGSIIDCQNQSLGQVVELVGTSYYLSYQSNRAHGGYQSHSSIRIPIAGDDVSPTLQRIELSIRIAGVEQTIFFDPKPNQYYEFTWDGKDAYGRTLQGQTEIHVSLSYVYPLIYQYTDRFGYNGNGQYALSASTQRAEFSIGKEWDGYIGTWKAPVSDIGGWSLNIHHVYDPQNKVLYFGNGSQQSNVTFIETVAEGLWNPRGLAIGPDGSVYVSGGNGVDARKTENYIGRINTDGTITIIAGGNTARCYLTDPCGDGGKALGSILALPGGISVGPDGSIYIADWGMNRIRKIDPQGIITTVAGTGLPGYSGDGGPATQATFDRPADVEVAPDGSLYIVDSFYGRIRRVDTNGIVSTVAGGGDCSNSGDGGPATQACLWEPRSITFGPDGSYYITGNTTYSGGSGCVRRVGPDGIIDVVAGCVWGWPYNVAEGDLATNAFMQFLRGVEVGPDGSLYITENDYSHNQERTVRVRKVTADGIITTVAGTGEIGFAGDGGTPRQAHFNGLEALTFGPDGNLYIADRENGRIRRIRSAFPDRNGDHEISVPSEDGSELYVFTSTGRHLRTLNALTGAVLYSFGYNDQGQLISVSDGDENKTIISRDAYGKPTGMVAPFGQVTKFALDPNGYLATVTNPAGEMVQFTYTDDGLMTSYRDPRNNEHIFQYDANGRLEKDSDPASGFKQLTRKEEVNAFTVTVSTAQGRATQYRVESLPTGTERHVNTYPDGTQSIFEIRPDATRFTQSPDGTRVTETLGPDPRWGLLAPIPQNSVITTPGGLTSTVTSAVSLTGLNGPFSFKTLTETTVINDRTYTSTYTAASRTWVEQSPEGRIVTTKTDEQGRIVFEQVTGLAPVNYVYDAHGRLEKATLGTGADARVATFTYNNSGWLESITDPLLRKVTFEYDLAGRIIKQTLPDQRVIAYAYDSSGNLKTLTPPGRPAHAFNYTPIDLQSQYIPPDLNSGEVMTQYDYNADHQLKTLTRPDGQTVSVGYDSAGRLDSLTIARGILDYNYNATTGNVESIAAPGNIKLAYGYDGALLTSQTWSGLFTGTTTFTYDENFRWKTTDVNGSDPITFLYNKDGILTQAGDLTLTPDPQTGLLDGSALGTITDSWSYNDFGEPVSYEVPSLFTVQYGRDSLGRIKKKTETIGGVTTVYEYDYDTAGRLWHVKTNNTLTATYEYDSNGNRLSVARPSGIARGTYDEQDRLQTYGSATYTYTANGELQVKQDGNQTTRYEYDELGNLLSVTLPDGKEITYLVDGGGRRVGKQVNGVLQQGFLYESQLRPIAELDGKGDIVSRFIYATRSNVPEYMIKDGQTYRFILDHLGSPRLIVNVADNSIAQRLDYDEFGQVVKDTNPGFQPFGFAGGLYDLDIGLVRLGTRDYDTEAGRWTAKDPIGFAGGHLSLYVYVANDPVNYKDTQGMWDTSKWMDGPSFQSTGEHRSNPASDTIVCDGRGGVKTQVNPNNGWASKECVQKHEQSHKDDALRDNPNVCQGKQENTQVKTSGPNQRAMTELRAYVIEIKCLIEKIKGAKPQERDPLREQLNGCLTEIYYWQKFLVTAMNNEMSRR